MAAPHPFPGSAAGPPADAPSIPDPGIPDPGIPDLHSLKAGARRAALAARAAAADPAHGARLAAHVLREAPPPAGAVIGGFWPMGDEIDPRPLLEVLAARGYAIALPVTPPRGQPLGFRRWRPGEALARGPLGTRQPAAGEAMRPDWLLVPLLAFDRAGRRLGYGGGYYDRTLPLLPGAVPLGVAHAGQEMAEVPAGPEDFRLPRIATERGIVTCGEIG
ncbi:5-formyltetrahydrofolate cyclo-ligase [Roseomonas sp. NAR14]|uniref:5-formyltetrahydrofolate cyclo-ligase n=1 Tax=Roseomonas acroporae TaxID=2937791 RepID=A0A9X1Y948_9PROT|nr:5-formyltetrahydrofolate cyclo-ligase [Roseomonas acroporae]MCK8785408.1 5-formyltetrahydrofolate cyclo-ligase [Roseomonas acroporae]